MSYAYGRPDWQRENGAMHTKLLGVETSVSVVYLQESRTLD